MAEFLQQLFNSLALGAIYALLALGYTLVYGVLRFINFAHADVFMVGAYLGWWGGQHLSAPSLGGALLVIVVAMLGCALLGLLIERLAYRPLRGAPTLNVLITAIGVSLLLQSTGQLVLGATPRTYPELLPAYVLQLGPVRASAPQLAVILLAPLLILFLQLLIWRTRLGLALRAVSLQPTAARLVGINPDTVIALTFALGSALAGAGGVLYAMNYPSIDPLMGVLPGLKAFIAAIIGGIGHLPGAALGGLLLGTAETFIGGSAFSTYKDALAFTLLILVLLFRPNGLLGRATTEKV